MGSYNIFISHSWDYDSQYNAIKALLENRPYFNFRDYSIPEGSKIVGTRKDVWNEIDSSIKMSSVLIIPANIYVSYSDSIKRELRIAKSYSKKIIAIKPRGQERISDDVQQNADIIVGWQAESLVEAIRKLC